MKITTIPAAQLSERHIRAWSEIHRARAELDSPFFRPEFTQAVASVRKDVEVAVLEEHGEMVGFFPYQRSRRSVAAPVGGLMSDFQAVIVRKNAAWDPRQLLQSCGLKTWHFNHLVVSQEELRPYHRLVEDSPYADLSGGLAAYCARHGRRVENPFPHTTIKARKLQRRLGPLRFEVDTQDQRVFDTLIEWKIRQYRRMHVANCFAFPWTRALVQRILNCRGEAFAGMLSALYAGDQLVAAHFGMRSDGVLHYWFIGYDPEFSQFSPGLIRDLKLMEAAASLGIRRLDFGKGMTDMKQYLMCGASQVAVGSVDLRPLIRILQRPWHRAYQWARNSPLRRPGARHCDVDFYCGEYALQQRDPSLLEALDDRVRVQRFGPFRIRDVRNLLVYSRLCQTLRDRHYDVIHFQTNAPPWMTPFWRTLRNVPLVLTVHDPYQHQGLPVIRSFYQDVMQKICVRRARKIIVHGRLLKEQILERYHDKSEGDVVVLPHGDLAIAKRWDHEGWGECACEKKILFFGSARPNKGLRHLLQAESLLHGRLEHYRMVVAGDCGDFSRFDRYIQPGARIDVINRFISNQELPGLFREAAVVVVPYTSATQSGIIALAYTFGKPVVATRVGALPEVVVDGVTGLLVEPGDERSLADAIVTLLSNDGLREEMGRNALKYCQEHMSWDAIARKTVEVYAELSGLGVRRAVIQEDQKMLSNNVVIEPPEPMTVGDSRRPQPRQRRPIRAWCREALGVLLRFSGAAWILRQFVCRHRATILVYHDPAPEVFDKHLAYLASRYTFIPLRRLVQAMQEHDWSDMPASPLVMTIDDGYCGNYRLLDSIRRWKLRPTIFLCSDIVNTRRHYWWKAGHERPEELKRLPRENMFDILRSETGFEPEKEYPERQSLSLSEIREMAPHVEFGSHTRIHPILINCTDEACREEIVQSKQHLEGLLGVPVKDFSYPNGDYRGRERQFVAEAPYQSARTMDVGWNDLRSDCLRLRAMAVDDDASINVLCAQTCGGFGYIHGWTLWRLLNIARRFAETP